MYGDGDTDLAHGEGSSTSTQNQKPEGNFNHASDMGMSRVPPIVSTGWLKQQLGTAKSRLRLLDATWHALESGHGAYLKKHIPGALFFDLNRCIEPKPTCARNLPERRCFQDYARSLGINNDSHLVIYDRTSIHASTKAWWTFKIFGHEHVSVLDGGMRKWSDDNFELVGDEETATQIGDFEVRFDRSLIAEYEDVVRAVKTRSTQVIDTRLLEHFLGRLAEPSIYTEAGLASMGQPSPSSMLAGHIPGSVNIFKSRVLDKKTRCFLPKEELIKLFTDHGIDPDKPIMTTCYMGHSATLLNMAALLCGNHNTSLYYGSWTEYGQKATPDLVVGPESAKL